MIRNTLSLLFCLLVALKLDGQQLPYYVVIGAYAVESNAQRATLRAHDLNYPAIYGYNSGKKFYYVYVRVSSDKDRAMTTLNDIRREGFRDAWIFQGALGGYTAPNPVATSTSTAPPSDVQPVSDEGQTATASAPSQEVINVSQSDVASINDEIVKSDSIPVEAGETGDKPAKPAGKGFVFKLLNQSTGNPVTGMIRLQESDRANQFRPYVGNDLVYVTPPVNRAGRWFIVCHVIGYKPLRTYFSYKDAEVIDGVTIGGEQEVILPVPLERVKRGDYIEMEEVKFYTNSNIMTPESERELKELLAMMNENPDYKIKVHGHTNGTQGRDIISWNEGQDLFTTDPANNRHAGSSKELSALRAESVKQYLVNNGVAENRISTKGEGGVQMIYDPKGTLGSLNDRVEVEVTKH
jgi:outer membrane protein OmpA-like peptidoglycan-associated protein